MTQREITLAKLAAAASIVFVAGSQSPVTVEALGSRHETRRRVRVSRPCVAELDGSDEPLVWEGEVAEWQAALAAELAY